MLNKVISTRATDSKELYNLGVRFFYGSGVPKGNPDAQYYLDDMISRDT